MITDQSEAPVLEASAVHAGYGKMNVLHGLTFSVQRGEIVALIGANGSGKTTTLKTLSGLVRARAGSIALEGADITKSPPHEIVRRGLIHVPEGRELFGGMTVRENLELGAQGEARALIAETLEEVHELFPILAERPKQRAESLSGGQQQMLAIGRALMARPTILMLDEPSLGLAPLLVRTVFDTVERIRNSGVTVLIVEQNAKRTLQVCDRAYVVEDGEFVMEGRGSEMVDDARVRAAYLGV